MKTKKATVLALVGSLILPLSLMSFKSPEVTKDFYKAKQKPVFTVHQNGTVDKAEVTCVAMNLIYITENVYVVAEEGSVTVAVLLLDKDNSSMHYKSLTNDQIFKKDQDVKMAAIDGN